MMGAREGERGGEQGEGRGRGQEAGPSGPECSHEGLSADSVEIPEASLHQLILLANSRNNCVEWGFYIKLNRFI